jgi:hypothetical protein
VIERAAVWGTAVFVVTSALAVAVRSTEVVAFVVAAVLFVAGTGVFLGALVAAAGRSREHEISIGGLFFLQGSAPTPVRRRLLGAFAVEVAVGLAAAAARPFTSLAFGVLVPMYGLGLTGLWAARYGTFGPRRPAPPRRNSR